MTRTQRIQRRRLLNMLRETGPRKRTVCVGLVGCDVFEELLAEGKIRTVGSKRGTEYAWGPPR